MRSHRTSRGFDTVCFCFNSDDELIKKKEVKGSSRPSLQTLWTLLSKGPTGGPAFNLEMCDERRRRVVPPPPVTWQQAPG